MEFPWIGLFLGLLFLVDPTMVLWPVLYRDLSPCWLANGVATRRPIKKRRSISLISFQFCRSQSPQCRCNTVDGNDAGSSSGGTLHATMPSLPKAASARAGIFSAILASARVGSQALILGCGAIRVIDANLPS
jgi:ABC-type protease/lipase transport system fused ATPase/permease subunit